MSIPNSSPKTHGSSRNMGQKSVRIRSKGQLLGNNVFWK